MEENDLWIIFDLIVIQLCFIFRRCDIRLGIVAINAVHPIRILLRPIRESIKLVNTAVQDVSEMRVCVSSY